MFTGKRAAIADHQISGFLDVLSVTGDTLFGLKIKVRPVMDAAMPKVSVKAAAIAVGLHQLAQVAQILTKFLWRDGGVFLDGNAHRDS